MKIKRKYIILGLSMLLVMTSVSQVFAATFVTEYSPSHPIGGGGALSLERLPEGKTIQDVKDSLVLTGLKAVGSGKKKVTLTWEAVSGAEGYIVYCHRSNTDGYSYIGMTTKGTTYTDNDALDNEYNFYRVYPYVVYNGSRIIGTCSEYTYAKGVAPAVTGITAKGAGKGVVQISWEASPGAEGYLVYGKRGKDGTYGYITMTTGATTVKDTNAPDDVYSFYWVFPYHLDAEGKRAIGPVSAEYAYAKGVIGPVTKPGLKAEGIPGGVKISWNAVAGAEGYIIYAKRPGETAFSYVSMTTKNLYYSDYTASLNDYTFYRVFPYHTNQSGKRVIGESGDYVYGKAKGTVGNNIPATAISLPTEVVVAPNNTLQLNATLSPVNSNSEITWKSWDETVFKVSSTGVVTGLKSGSAYVTAVANGKSARTLVRVEVPATGISVSLSTNPTEPISEFSMFVGAKRQLKAILEPSDASSRVTWKSWDESLFTVDQYGNVTGISPGTHYVTASSNGLSARVRVRVDIQATGISLPEKIFATVGGAPIQLTPTLTPSNATSIITWKSYNEDVVSIDANGRATLKDGGTAFVTAVVDGKSASCQIVVGGWKNEGGKRYYFDPETGYKKKGKVTINGIKYYFNTDTGEQMTGLVPIVINGETFYYYYLPNGGVGDGLIDIGGKTYCFDGSKDGLMQKGSQTINNKKYYFDMETGEMKTGFVTLSGSGGSFTYYYLPEGGIATGFKEIDGNKYYFDTSSGVRAQGVRTIDEKRYYFDPQSGVMQTGFHTVELSNGTYTFYFLPEGDVAKNMQTIAGKTYYFGTDGALQKDKLIVIDGKRHYFTAETGELAVGVYKANNDFTYYFDPEMADGVRHGVQVYEGETYMFHNVDGYALSRFQSQGASLYYFDENTYKLKKNATWQYAGIEFTADSNGLLQMDVLDTTNKRSVILSWALSHLGIPYGSDTDSLVCSSFVAEAYRQVGYTGLGEPRPAPYTGYTMESFEQAQYTLANGLVYDNIESIQPGDVIFWNQGNCADGASCEHYFQYGGVNYHIHHIGIYVGNGQVVEEAESVGWSLVQNILLPTDDFYIAFYADLLTQPTNTNN